MGQRFQITTEETFGNAVKEIRDLWVRFGRVILIPDCRSYPGHSLLELYDQWVEEIAAFMLKRPVNLLSAVQVDGMHQAVKRRFYQETGSRWMMQRNIDPIDGGRRDENLSYAKSERWPQSGLIEMLDWLRAFAKREGLQLKPVGEYEKLLKEKAA